ncbi:hypothetical protein H6G89_15530 [Oscillatoria sp. FACHB-1407]|uniref:hypothetical protein n=1 Tax=Oscillatoria sp. FACHB-1407 TaxID=2692847 RepID=UPI0016862F9C|nr:hypothetical protein [Oscillatoria sp. FACHB-1407]MBD2462458.1 hypothetical protein [Oscillatoria sp. FACHB-1407]
MIRTLPATLRTAMQRRLRWSSGRASVRFACEGLFVFEAVFAVKGVYRPSHKSVREGIFTAIAEWLNSDHLTESGRCRVTLAPT